MDTGDNIMNKPEGADEETSAQDSNMPSQEPQNEQPPIATPPPVVDPTPQVSTAMEGKPIEKEGRSAGPIVGSIIIIVIIIIGGLYFWGKQLTKEETVLEGLTAEEIAAQPDTELEALQTQSSSDEITDITADLEATNLDGLDEDLVDIDLSF